MLTRHNGAKSLGSPKTGFGTSCPDVWWRPGFISQFHHDVAISSSLVPHYVVITVFTCEVDFSIISFEKPVRVIAGKYRGRRLRTVEGLGVRPTSDRLRETLFNILKPRIEGSRFLDICAGSGAVGIEALSRGASEASFVERSPRACSAIRANLDALGAGKEAVIINRDAESALRLLAREPGTFDIAFLDPPYASEVYGKVMLLLGRGELLSSDAIAVVEHRAKHPPEAQYGKLCLYRTVKQGESSLAFYTLEARVVA